MEDKNDLTLTSTWYAYFQTSEETEYVDMWQINTKKIFIKYKKKKNKSQNKAHVLLFVVLKVCVDVYIV